MVKKFTVPCDFSGKKLPVTFYVGNAAIGSHPIGFQSAWLGKEKGGTVPDQLMKSLAQIKEIADKNKVSFEELCSYVIDEVNSASEVIQNMKNKNQTISENQKDEQKTN